MYSKYATYYKNTITDIQERNDRIYKVRMEFNELKNSNKIEDYDNCLDRAIIYNIYDIVEYFILKFDPNYIIKKSGLSLLGTAILHNNYYVTKLLLENKADINILNNFKNQKSIFCNCLDQIQYLDKRIMQLVINHEKFIFTKDDFNKLWRLREPKIEEEIILEILKKKNITIYSDIVNYAIICNKTKIINYAVNNFNANCDLIPKELIINIFSFL